MCHLQRQRRSRGPAREETLADPRFTSFPDFSGIKKKKKLHILCFHQINSGKDKIRKVIFLSHLAEFLLNVWVSHTWLPCDCNVFFIGA